MPSPALNPSPPIFHTDQEALIHYFRQHENKTIAPIFTTEFLKKSRDSYSPAWLAREIAQNFVDHNPHARGTLDGVSIKETGKPPNVTFAIQGKWKFEDLTGLIAAHSEKEELVGVKSAGGNGIGLKQVALRYLRDLNVDTFDIHGENWTVKYRLVKAEDINQRLRTSGDHQTNIKHDWLVAEIIKPTKKTGSCIYEISSSNLEVIRTLRELKEIAVCKDNPYLKDLDYVCPQNKGAWKWLLPSSTDAQIPMGRLFMNGQVFACKEDSEHGKSKKGWPGPAGIVIQLNNVDYQMSIDRPPLSHWDVANKASDLISRMSRQELVDQLKASEAIWQNDAVQQYSFRLPIALHVIEKIVSELKNKHKYRRSDFDQDFPKNQYRSYTSSLSQEQIKEIKSQGYAICPEFFTQLGVPSAKTLFASSEIHPEDRPNPDTAVKEMREQSAKTGIMVTAKTLGINDAKDIAKTIVNNLKGFWHSVEQIDSETIRLNLQGSPFSADLLAHPLPHPKRPEQEALYCLRSLIQTGLTKNWLQDALLASGHCRSSFLTNYDYVTQETMLLSRTNEHISNPESFYLDLKLTPELASFFSAETINRALKALEVSSMPPRPIESDIEGSGWLWPITVCAGVVAIIGAAFWWNNNSQQDQAVTQTPKVPEVRKAIVSKPESPADSSELKKTLDNLPAEKSVATHNQDEYLAWKMRGKSLPPKPNQRTDGKTVSDIILEMNLADIESSTAAPEDENTTLLRQTLQRLQQSAHVVEDLKIEHQPSERELAKLACLRDYFTILTGVNVDCDLFIFEGKGAKGINFQGKSIGIHREMMDVSFEEALVTFVHEVAHTYQMNHDTQFIHAVQGLLGTMHKNLNEINFRTRTNQSTDQDRELMRLRYSWYN